MSLLLSRNKSQLTFIRAVELGEKLAAAHRCLADAERVGVRQLDGNRLSLFMITVSKCHRVTPLLFHLFAVGVI